MHRPLVQQPYIGISSSIKAPHSFSYLGWAEFPLPNHNCFCCLTGGSSSRCKQRGAGSAGGDNCESKREKGEEKHDARQPKNFYLFMVLQVLTNCYSYRKCLSQSTCAWARWLRFECVCFLSCLLDYRKWTAPFTRAVRLPDEPKKCTFFSGDTYSLKLSPSEQTNPCPPLPPGGPARGPCSPRAVARSGAELLHSVGDTQCARSQPSCAHHFLSQHVVSWWRGCGQA